MWGMSMKPLKLNISQVFTEVDSDAIANGPPVELPADVLGYAPRDITKGEQLTIVLWPEQYFITSDGLRSLTAEEAAALREKRDAR